MRRAGVSPRAEQQKADLLSAECKNSRTILSDVTDLLTDCLHLYICILKKRKSHIHLHFFNKKKKWGTSLPKKTPWSTCLMPNKNICPSLQTAHICLYLCVARALFCCCFHSDIALSNSFLPTKAMLHNRALPTEICFFQHTISH